MYDAFELRKIPVEGACVMCGLALAMNLKSREFLSRNAGAGADSSTSGIGGPVQGPWDIGVDFSDLL